MGRIRRLKEDVYKKIAAGEVIERPLSVVKELVENALDAGADDIKITLIKGGKELIRIEDNGQGFDPEDIEIAFQRYSTSKIMHLEDLDTLNTLGFRGEALPSILEVSELELKTSNSDEGIGFHCVFKDQRLQTKKEIPYPRGSVIDVRFLFYNFPVRKKFLKSDRAELNRITNFLETIALANFRVSFELVNNNRSLFSLKGTEKLEDRIYQIFGHDFLGGLQSLDFALGDYHLKGYVSKPGSGVSLKNRQHYFVNRRPVRERTMMAAFNQVYEKYLERGKVPVGILFLDMPGDEVDVNIHPAKLEIRFRDPQAVFRFLQQGVKHLFEDQEVSLPDIEKIDFQWNRERISEDRGVVESASQSMFESVTKDDFTVLGQYNNSYILVQKQDELLIIDQHNAHERILYDQLKERYRSKGISSVVPLFPVVIDLSPSERMNLDDEAKDYLTKVGFDIQFLSGSSIAVKHYPHILNERDIRDTFLTLISLEKSEVGLEDRMMAEIACKSAIKANRPLLAEEMKKIVRDLFNTTNPRFCPHQRPVLITFSLSDIEKKLKRR